MELQYFLHPELSEQVPFSERTVKAFRKLVYTFYREYGRTFPWRETRDPYSVLVSEIMLQQTQVSRVVGKYQLFMRTFPNIHTLHRAPFERVLGVWKGLGYNRRCISLKRCAEIITREHGSVVPDSEQVLVKLPGVGPSTAAGVRCFAYGKPALYLETNIRTLFIHIFFPCQERVHDREILPLLKHTLDRTDPRHWYFALMDYGAMLKREVGNLSSKSSKYTMQTPFKGSDRQLRGRILELLLEKSGLSLRQLTELLDEDAQRLIRILNNLEHEGFIQKKGQYVTLSE